MLATVLRLADVGSLVVAFVATLLVVAEADARLSLAEFLSIRLKVENFIFFFALVGVWRMTFSAFALYSPERPLLGIGRLRDAHKAIAVSVLILAGSAFLFDVDAVGATFVVAFGLVSSAAVSVVRLVLRGVSTFVKTTSESKRSVLIFGTGPKAVEFARRYESEIENSCRIAGFVDDDWAGIGEFRQSGFPLVADSKHLDQFLRNNVVDELVVAVPLEALVERSRSLLSHCREHGVNVRFLSSVLAESVEDSASAQLADEVVMTVFNGRVDGWPLLLKRAIDVGMASILLVILCPALAVVAILVKTSSPGPVIFTQERVGLNKRRFRMLKFRTMDANAEDRLVEVEHLNEMDGAAFKIAEDPRITPLGAVLRRWSVDELPQFVNVLRGEMSLVGPRPLPLRDVELFEGDEYRRRFSVRPGITGFWQVSGRNTVSFAQWMEYDLQYVDEWSLALDLKILAKTLPTVISRLGAM